jgi:hypothetical protein
MSRGSLKIRRPVQAFMAIVLALFAGGCSTSGNNRPTPSSANNKIPQAFNDEVERFLARYQPIVKGRFGTSNISAYLDIPIPRLTDQPYGPEDGFLLASHGEYAAAPHPTEMPALSRVIVRGQVLAGPSGSSRRRVNRKSDSCWVCLRRNLRLSMTFPL